MRHLRALASGQNDAATMMYTDTDVFSTRQSLRKETTVPREDEEGYLLYMKRFAPRYYDDQLQCRSANYVEYRYNCLFITGDNVRTVLDSLSDTQRQTLFGVIGHRFEKRLQIDLETLNKIEKQWTGNTRNPFTQRPSTIFYTAVVCITYISSGWNLIRELCSVAIQKDDRVIRKLNIQTWRLNRDHIPQAIMLSALRRLQVGSPAEVLLDAITRRCVMLEHIKTVDTIDLTSSETIAAGRMPIIEPVVRKGKIHRGVHDIYGSFQKGMIEPEEAFLTISKKHCLQDRLQPGVPRFPTSNQQPLRISGSSCVWVYGLGPKMKHPTPNLCLYFVQDVPTTVAGEKLEHYAVSAFERQDVYHTIRSGCLAKRHRALVNQIPCILAGAHGVSIQALKAFPTSIRQPTSQGWLNPSAGSGRFMYERNLMPWQDPEEKGVSDPENLFICYKLIKEGMEYWAEVAKGHASHGIPCCKICAFVGAEVVCDVCTSAMHDRAQPLWFRQMIKETVSRIGSPDLQILPAGLPSQAVEHEDDKHLDLLKSFPTLEESFSDLGDLRRQQEVFCEWMNCRERTRSSKRRRFE